MRNIRTTEKKSTHNTHRGRKRKCDRIQQKTFTSLSWGLRIISLYLYLYINASRPKSQMGHTLALVFLSYLSLGEYFDCLSFPFIPLKWYSTERYLLLSYLYIRWIVRLSTVFVCVLDFGICGAQHKKWNSSSSINTKHHQQNRWENNTEHSKSNNIASYSVDGDGDGRSVNSTTTSNTLAP